ncbi:hypothetical protein Tco_0421858 [Tanacetum coccineum]
MDGSVNKSGSSLKYPPGVTPSDGNDENSTPAEDGMIRKVEEVRTDNREENNDAFSDWRANSYTKEVGTESLSSGHFKKSELPKTGGSILGLLDDVVKVGQVMSYKMEGCISNMDAICYHVENIKRKQKLKTGFEDDEDVKEDASMQIH